MSFESFIALRYLMARSKQTFISVISVTSILGVALGVASLIVVLGVMNGFTKDLRDKILGVNAHAITMSIGGGIANYESVMEKVQGVPDITGVTPFIYSEVMISTASGVKGLVLRGVDPATAEKVLSIREHMEDGSFASLEQDGMPGIIIGKELAQRLGVGIGGRVNLLSPTGTKTATGFTPRVRICRIVGLFKTGMWEYDSSLGFVSLGFARDLLGWKGDTVTGLEMTVRDV